MDLVRDPYTGEMVDRRTGLPVDGVSRGSVPAERVNFMDRLLAGTGVSERIMAVHQLFNPVTALAEAGRNSQVMLDPATNPMGRVAALGGMLTGMAGTVAPMYAASRGAVPTTNAMVDALTGINMPGGEFLADEFGGVKLPGKDGITAYHGSPHSFDRFSMDKIGTGEGAQAYGHGLYFAENEGVAKGYRDALQFKAPAAVDGIDGGARYLLQNAIKDARKYPAAERAEALQRWLTETEEMANGKFAPPGMAADIAEAKRLLETGEFTPDLSDAGSMYEVRINANPDDFLDWDKPLSEQPAWKKIARSWGGEAEAAERLGFDPDAATGRQYLDAVAPQGAGEAFRGVSRRLAEEGIPGIKYLDAGSRSAGDGSRNYVVFDENLIEIVRKYGVAGAAAMLGVSAMDVEAAMAGAP